MMDELIARYALLWIAAERLAGAEHARSVARDAELDGRDEASQEILRGASGERATPDEVAFATDRVWQVLKGEVRWSEASPGDRAVWRGRFRNVEAYVRTARDLPVDNDGTNALQDAVRRQPFQPPLRGVPTYEIPRTANVLAGTPAPAPPPPGPNNPGPGPDDLYAGTFSGAFNRESRRTGPRLHGYRERIGYHYYDTVTMYPVAPGVRPMPADTNLRFFSSNASVGDFFRTNMVHGGKLPGGTSFVVLSWWLWCSSLEAMAELANDAYAVLVIDNMPRTPHTFARDLYMGVSFLPPYSRPLIIPQRQGFHVQMTLRQPIATPCDVMMFIEGLQTRDVQ